MKKNKLFLIISLVLLFNSQIYASQVWKSIILPGWGEQKLGYKDKGNLFMFSEYILWGGFMFSDDQYISYRKDYKSNAEHYAGVNWSGKNALYAADVGNYISIAIFNEHQNSSGVVSPYQGSDYDWDWGENIEEWVEYDTLRNKSERYSKIKNFLVAGAILNRLISIIDVLILERRNKITSELIYDNNNTASLKIHYSF